MNNKANFIISVIIGLVIYVFMRVIGLSAKATSVAALFIGGIMMALAFLRRSKRKKSYER